MCTQPSLYDASAVCLSTMPRSICASALGAFGGLNGVSHEGVLSLTLPQCLVCADQNLSTIHDSVIPIERLLPFCTTIVYVLSNCLRSCGFGIPDGRLVALVERLVGSGTEDSDYGGGLVSLCFRFDVCDAFFRLKDGLPNVGVHLRNSFSAFDAPLRPVFNEAQGRTEKGSRLAREGSRR